MPGDEGMDDHSDPTEDEVNQMAANLPRRSEEKDEAYQKRQESFKAKQLRGKPY